MTSVIATLAATIPAYIRHLFKADESFGLRLTSYHNLYFLLHLMKNVREAIMNDNLVDFRAQFFEEYGYNQPNPKNFWYLIDWLTNFC